MPDSAHVRRSVSRLGDRGYVRWEGHVRPRIRFGDQWPCYTAVWLAPCVATTDRLRGGEQVQRFGAALACGGSLGEIWERLMRRTIVVLLSALLLVAGFAPAAAAPPDNPFVGSWESDDDFPGGDLSHSWLQIGGNGHFHLRDNAATVCLNTGFGFVPATFTGFGEITGTDPWTFSGTGELYCYTRDGRGRQLAFSDFGLSLVFDPSTGTLDLDGFIAGIDLGPTQQCATEQRRSRVEAVPMTLGRLSVRFLPGR